MGTISLKDARGDYMEDSHDPVVKDSIAVFTRVVDEYNELFGCTYGPWKLKLDSEGKRMEITDW